MSKSNQRINWIDFGKGLTVLMVVLGHVVLGLFESNRFEASETVLLFITQVFYLFHIPVFFALSGFFFRPLESPSGLWKFVVQRTIALGIPYLFYSVIQFSLQSLGGDTVRNAASFSDLLRIYETPLGVSWYLYVLWWIYLVLGIVSLRIKKAYYLLYLTLVAYLLSLAIPSPIYIVQKLLLWTFFFILGYWLKQSGCAQILEKNWKVITGSLLVTIIVFMMFWQLSEPEFYISYDRPGAWGLIFPVSVFLAFAVYPILFKVSKFGEYFRKIGKDSLVVYLLHAPIVSVTRIILLKLGFDNVILHILLGLAAGWFGSILGIYLIKSIPFCDAVFYPLNYIRPKKK
ncbi:acyltransferase [Streptococcus suis]|uniref:Acyltransferase n=1 Tax=Streptococcus suis TaxID=1307 RepID=A0A4T2GMW2_STRSU|nr:acyltransferase [Streptococcus suis]MBM7268757.1 acyltransferase [Streptococcus suis]MBM7269529.1 acyltransferase [Streptococcus suis]MBM7313890.1 acyltransferase [Streptococcus suis]TII00476.1 acyltransferase [Streptococcus suis]